MSPKQFIIIGVSAAAALLSNSPLVAAIGSVAQHNTPTDDYPPPDENANFDAKNDAAYCSFNNKRIDEISQSKLLHIDVNSSRIHMRRIHCPKGGKHEILQIGFFDENALTWYSRGHDVFPDRRIFTFDALPGSFPPENTGLDPFRHLNASTLADAITELSSAIVRALGRTKLYEHPNLRDNTEAGQSARGKLAQLCADAVTIISQEFGSFDELCDSSQKVGEGTLHAAINSVWHSRVERAKTLTLTKLTPPHRQLGKIIPHAVQPVKH